MYIVIIMSMGTAAVTSAAVISAAATAKENLISAVATAKDMCAETNNLLFYAFFSHQRLKPA